MKIIDSLLLILVITLLIPWTAYTKSFAITKNETREDSVSILQLSWLVGHWSGEGMGGFNEEIWTDPIDNKMVGVFRHIKNDKIVFYELLTIMLNEENRPVLRLKHFNPDLKGWEEKNEVVEFKLLHMEPKLVEFDGLSMQLIEKNTLLVTVKFNEKSGDISTEQFKLYRKSY